MSSASSGRSVAASFTVPVALQTALRYGAFPVIGLVFWLAYAEMLRLGVSKLTLFYCLAAIVTVACPILERLIPYNEAPLSQRVILDDLLAFVVDRTVYMALLGGLTAGLSAALAPALAVSSGLRLPLSPWLSWPLLLLVFELWLYWLHRWLHEVPVLWRAHATHHAPTSMVYFNQYRRHIVSVVFMGGLFVPLPLLLGVDEAFVTWRLAASIFITAFQHINADIRLGALNYILSCSPCHRFHHADDRRLAHANYGTLLVVWDHVFGTFVNPNTTPPPETLGLFADTPDGYPKDSYARQLRAAFDGRLWQKG